MTTRSRPRPGGTASYTARLHQRTAAPRPAPRRPSRTLPALLTLAAETGHLSAALIEWPAAPARGLFHTLAAAGLGLLAPILYFGRSQVESLLGIVFILAIPAAWIVGALVGLSPYRDLPPLAAGALSIVELGAVGLLAVRSTAASSSTTRTSAARQARSAGKRR